MDPKELSTFYNTLKGELNGPVKQPTAPIGPAGSGLSTPGAQAWHNQAINQSKAVVDNVCKRIILDIYCRTVPLDKEYIDGNQGVLKGDIDNFLSNKGMNATQYLTSSKERVNAPLLEFILRSANNAGKQFVEEADKKLNAAQTAGVVVDPPVAGVETQETENLLVDVKKDCEYEAFIDELKQKTINKIVKDVSKIITDEKDKENMTFSPKTESVIEVGINHIHKQLWNENVEMTPEREEMVVALAIREATLNGIDLAFKNPEAEIRPFSSQVRFGKGAVINEKNINESVINFL